MITFSAKNLFKFKQMFPPALVWEKMPKIDKVSTLSTGNLFSPDSVPFCYMSEF